MRKASCWKKIKKTLQFQTKEFFKNSTLHGVHYVADENLNALERFIWLTFCSASLVSTAVIIVLLWKKFQTNPTITGLDTDFHDWNVPFPAITLCSSHPHRNMWNTSNLNVITDKLKEGCFLPQNKNNNSNVHLGKDINMSNFLIKLASLNYNNLEAFKGISCDGTVANLVLRSLMLEISAHCEDIYMDCKWKGEIMNSCCSPDHHLGLRPIFTDHGFCYSFNSQKALHSWPWLNVDIKKHQVLQIYETDESWDFSFNLKDIKYFPVKVFIHGSDEVPASDDYFQHKWDGRVGQLAFSAKKTYTTQRTRQLSVRQRHCVFPDEVQLNIDPDGYTHSGCMRECHSDEAVRICGCIPPFINEIGKYKHCNLSGINCLAEHSAHLRNEKYCNCDLSCENTVYEVEKLSEDLCIKSLCHPLRIGFISWPMVRYKREVLFGWIDLLVSFGGIAGLFLGFSLLSGVEIIYYFILRALCLIFMEPKKPNYINKHKYKKSRKANRLKFYSPKNSNLNGSAKLKYKESHKSEYWNKRHIPPGKKQNVTSYKLKHPIEYSMEYLP